MKDTEEVSTRVNWLTAIKILVRLGYTCTALILFIIFAAASLLNFETSRLWLVKTAVEKINQSNIIHINIEGMKTRQLYYWQVDSVKVNKGNNILFEANNILLKWQPSALLLKKIVITSLNTKEVKMYSSNSTIDTNEEKKHSISLESIKLPHIKIIEFNIENLEFIGSSSTPPTQTLPSLKLNANAHWSSSSSFILYIQAQTLEHISTQSMIKISSDKLNDILIKGEITESAKGSLSRLLKLPKDQGIDVNFLTEVHLSQDDYQLKINQLSFMANSYLISTKGRLQISNTFDHGHINDLTIKTNEFTHHISGAWSNESLDISVNLTDFPLDILSPFKLPLENGKISSQLKVSGSYLSPTADGVIKVNSTYRSLPFEMDVQGIVDKNHLDIKKSQFNLDQAIVTALGKVDFKGSQTHLSLDGKNINLNIVKVFNTHIPKDLEATLTSGKAKIYGNIKNLDGNVTALINGKYQHQAFHIETQISKNGDSITVENTDFNSGLGVSNIKGNINTKSLEGNWRVVSNELSLEIARLLGITVPEDISAKMNAEVEINGHILKPTITGTANIFGNYQDIPFSISAEGKQMGNSTKINTLALKILNNEALSITGTINSDHLDLIIIASRLPRELLTSKNVNVPPGQFDALIKINGSPYSPNIDARLNYKAAVIGYDSDGDKKDIQLEWMLNMNNLDQKLTLHSTFTKETNQNSPAGYLIITIPTQPLLDYFSHLKDQPSLKLPLESALKGKFNLQMLSFLVDPELHRFNGEIDIDLHTSGTVQQPELKGETSISNGSYESLITGTIINRIECIINANQFELTTSNCKANDGGSGKYNIVGKLRIPVKQNAGLVDIQLQTQQVNIIRRTDIESEATGDIHLLGDFNTVQAKGNIEVAPLTIEISSNLKESIPTIDIEMIDSNNENSSTVDSSPKKSHMPDINLDFLVSAQQQANIRGRGLEAELQGQIKIHGNIKNPRYDGQFNTKRGVFEIFGKKFIIEQSQVNFTNGAIGLSMNGVYEKNGQRIQALITGTQDNLQIRFTAVPAMSEEEILAFIIFGKSIQHITALETIQLATAVQKLRGGDSSFDVIGGARDLLGVDTLAIESAETQDGKTGINIGFGKYISDKVYLELQRTPDPTHPWKGNIQVELSPNVKLESSTTGKSGLDGAILKWKKDY